MAELHVAKTCIVKKKCQYELVKKNVSYWNDIGQIDVLFS